MRKAITIPNVDVGLLRKQRNTCLMLLKKTTKNSRTEEHLLGIINMLDDMLDIADRI